MVKCYSIFADYHQFYLLDHEQSPDAPTQYTEADTIRRVKTGPFLVVVQPERDADVPVEVEIRDDPPDCDFAAWDHVTEASLDLPSGKLEIHECTGGSIDILAVSAGTYRVKSYHGGLGTLSENGLDGADHYRIVLWPAPFAELDVLKQYVGPVVAP